MGIIRVRDDGESSEGLMKVYQWGRAPWFLTSVCIEIRKKSKMQNESILLSQGENRGKREKAIAGLLVARRREGTVELDVW